MTHAEFVYVVYIRATEEQVWSGLLEPEFTRKYWRHEHESDWEVGSGWAHVCSDGSRTVRVVGTVLENERPNRLVFTWAEPEVADDRARTSKVTYEISPQEWPGGPWVRLKVTHSDLVLESDMFKSISFGWPAVISGLKTLMEKPDAFDAM